MGTSAAPHAGQTGARLVLGGVQENDDSQVDCSKNIASSP
jgi:hypothetical protein